MQEERARLSTLAAPTETRSNRLRILATARLYLDNVDHIQGSWFSEGKKTGQISLHFGADDFGEVDDRLRVLYRPDLVPPPRWEALPDRASPPR